LREDHAKTTPSLRSSSGTDLKVKPMLDGRLRRKSRHVKAVINYVMLAIAVKTILRKKL